MLNPIEIEALKLSGFIAIVAVSISIIPGIIIHVTVSIEIISSNFAKIVKFRQ